LAHGVVHELVTYYSTIADTAYTAAVTAVAAVGVAVARVWVTLVVHAGRVSNEPRVTAVARCPSVTSAACAAAVTAVAAVGVAVARVWITLVVDAVEGGR
jgi:hypothetical protein